MDSTGIVIGFWVLSGVTVASALLVLLARNLLHSLVFLVITFLGMAGLFITLSADFIAVAQILIYAGSISVLMVFAVMLTPPASRHSEPTKRGLEADASLRQRLGKRPIVTDDNMASEFRELHW